MSELQQPRDACDLPDGLTLRDAVRAMARERGATSSLCPSEVARALDDTQWRRLMPAVRQAAAELARAGEVQVLQRGEVQNPDGPWRGPIRIRVCVSGCAADQAAFATQPKKPRSRLL